MSDKPLTFRFNGTEVVPAAFGPGDLDEMRRLHASLSLGPDAPTVGFPDFHHFSQIAMIEEQMWMCGRERRRLRRKALRDGTFVSRKRRPPIVGLRRLICD